MSDPAPTPLLKSSFKFLSSVSELKYFNIFYRATHQVVPKLSIEGICNSHTGPESRVWEQLDASPCKSLGDFGTSCVSKNIIEVHSF